MRQQVAREKAPAHALFCSAFLDRRKCPLDDSRYREEAVSRKSVITAHAQWLVKRTPFREGVAMKAMTIDSTPAARRISALRSSVRNLEEALGSILDVVGNDDYPLDENARDELMRLIGQALVITFSLITAFDELQGCFPL